MTPDISLSGHFIRRVQQRLPGVSPYRLARALKWAVDNKRADLAVYEGRVKKRRGGCSVSRRFRHVREGAPDIIMIVSDDVPGVMTFVTAFLDQGETNMQASTVERGIAE